MLVKIVCGVAVYVVYRQFFAAEDETFDPKAISESSALFYVADRLEKKYDGKAYVGLRIPDADVSSHRDIDIVLVRKGDVVVVSLNSGSTLEERKQQVEVLDSYLKQRGVFLPKENLSCEVITYEKGMEMKPESLSTFSRLFKGVSFRGWKKETEDVIQKNLTVAVSTAPMWDRVELKDNKFILGKFQEFSGFQDDVETLRKIKRSKVSRLIFQKSTIFGFATSKLQILYSPRDYRNDPVPSMEWKEVTVSSYTTALFLPRGGSRVCKFYLGSVVSMSLSA